MAFTTISSREFNQNTHGAKRAAKNGPVMITDRGKPAHVLLTIEEYQRLTNTSRKIADSLALPGAEIEFEPARVFLELKSADLS